MDGHGLFSQGNVPMVEIRPGGEWKGNFAHRLCGVRQRRKVGKAQQIANFFKRLDFTETVYHHISDHLKGPSIDGGGLCLSHYLDVTGWIAFPSPHQSTKQRTELSPSVPWKEKRCQAVMRASAVQVGRMKIVAVSLASPRELDARIYLVKKGCVQVGDKYREVSALRKMWDDAYSGEAMSPLEQSCYAYIVDFAGIEALRWKLLSGSVVIRARDGLATPRFWFDDDLVDGEHYIGCEIDEIPERVRWLREHDEEARRIGQAGQRKAAEILTPEFARARAQQMLEA